LVVILGKQANEIGPYIRACFAVSNMASSSNKFERRRKRPYEKTDESSPSKKKVDENSPVIVFFKEIQQELDSRYDKHERIVKFSRDLTIHSKRIIFLLQRVAGADSKQDILKEAEQKLLDVKEFLKGIALELVDEDPYRFGRAFSPGVQEYIEALSFYHYIKHLCLIPYQEVQNELHFNLSEETVVLDVSPFDYVLGIADLTGELMRLCLNSAANGDTDTPFEVCKFLRQIHDDFVALGNINRDVSSKLRVLNNSLNKVERACYTLEVRGSEIPKHMLADLISSGPDQQDTRDDY
jgi:predicted translin family RNA/ssDNA-binding protein